MDYQKHYDQLINRAKNRLLEGYTERHHIIPKCIGGTNRTDNLIRLTPEEHYVAHQLLVKIYPNKPKLVYAATMMTRSSSNQKRNNKLYGWLKRKASATKRKWAKDNNIRPPVRNKPHKEETKRKISEATKGRIGSRSMLGRTGKNSPHFGKKRSEEQKSKMREWQQRNYQLICPQGRVYYMKTYELKQFCEKNNLSWSLLMRAKKKDRPLKGWKLNEVQKMSNIMQKVRPKVDF